MSKLAVCLATAWLIAARMDSGTQDAPATSQATTTQAAPDSPHTPSTLRKPRQVEVLKELLRQRDTPRPLSPAPLAPVRHPGAAGPTGEAGSTLLLEGTILIERRGRVAKVANRWDFILYADPTTAGPEAMEIVPNQYLEAIEKEVAVGITEFKITGEVLRYRGRNLILIRKVLRFVENGNLAP